MAAMVAAAVVVAVELPNAVQYSANLPLTATRSIRVGNSRNRRKKHACFVCILHTERAHFEGTDQVANIVFRGPVWYGFIKR